VGLPAPELPDLWNPNSTRVILHPGSGGAAKVWPHFRELALAMPEATILLGPCETPLGTENQTIENLSLEKVAEELRDCRQFIGNDSGITHIAAYWGTPTVALFGPTDPKVWGPIGRRVKIETYDAATRLYLPH
jgi:ADP-heptose:LPS heptosyltransferase